LWFRLNTEKISTRGGKKSPQIAPCKQSKGKKKTSLLLVAVWRGKFLELFAGSAEKTQKKGKGESLKGTPRQDGSPSYYRMGDAEHVKLGKAKGFLIGRMVK